MKRMPLMPERAVAKTEMPKTEMPKTEMPKLNVIDLAVLGSTTKARAPQ